MAAPGSGGVGGRPANQAAQPGIEPVACGEAEWAAPLTARIIIEVAHREGIEIALAVSWRGSASLQVVVAQICAVVTTRVG